MDRASGLYHSRLISLVLTMLVLSTVTSCSQAVKREMIGVQHYGSQEAHVEEIRFRSGKFRLEGDLRFPDGEGPHPAIIMVHGDGPVTRDGYPTTFLPAIEVFLRSGYAVFSWDKPGSGESKGKFNKLTQERGDILVDGIDVLVEHPAIDPTQIGLWGISQAGWVMPLALEQTDKVAFMIVVSGGGENGVHQYAYQVGQKVSCAGGSAEQAALVDQAWVQAFSTTDYQAHREAIEFLLSNEVVRESTGIGLPEEKNWIPLIEDNPSAFYDPMEILAHTTIPVLAFFGELDKNVDPIQGAEAYEAALQKAGNSDYMVVLIPGVAHSLVPADTGCLNEIWGSEVVPQYLETMEIWIKTHTK
jgi:pimeloyl-ACP methyl ester carboxylesterase